MVWLTAFYAPLLPLGTLICIINIVLYYFATKYIFLKRLSIPRNFGSSLSIEMIKMLEFVPLIFGISLRMYNSIFDKGLEGYSIAIIVIGCVYSVLPMGSINTYFWPDKRNHNHYIEFS